MRDISNKYAIPKSTIYWFKDNAHQIKNEYSIFNFQIIDKFKEQIKYRNFIYDQVKPPTSPMTLDKICTSFLKKFKIHLNKREVKSFLKNDLRFSFKKGSSAVWKIAKMDNIIMRKIFALHLLCFVLKEKLIISIDEVSFNRKLVNNYSWLPKSQATPIINIEAKGRWSMITGFISNGDHISMLYNSTITAKNFSQFLTLLKYVLTAN